MGGFVFVTSKGIGAGSQFFVCIPHKLDCPLISQPLTLYSQDQNTSLLSPSPRASAPEIPMDQLPSKRILFAEVCFTFKNLLKIQDNFLTQKVIRLLLEKLGFEVVVADNGKEAEELFCQAPSDFFFCALLDYEMPRQNGLMTAKRLRAAQEDLPIVILTAHSTDKDKEECLESGANDFLTKPVTLLSLQLSLAKCVPSRKKPQSSNVSPDLQKGSLGMC
jgi:CheY-like chemotaxis protein